MLYNLISSPDLLSNRRAVIMIGSPQLGLWGKIQELPKYILDDAKSISLEKTIQLDSSDLLADDKESLNISYDADTGTTIEPNGNKQFSIVLSIPNCKEKKTCMIRINFWKSGVCTFRTSDINTKEIIESNAQISYGSNSHQDLFIPVFDEPRNIRIDFITKQTQTIRNIELWYY